MFSVQSIRRCVGRAIATISALIPRALCAAFLAIGLASCDASQWTGKPRTPLMVVGLVDRSASYPALDRASHDLMGLLDSLGGGDRLLVRFVSEASHAAGENVVDFTVLEPPTNTLDPRSRTVRDSARARLAAVRQALEEMGHRPRAQRTDYIGGVAIASELFATAQPGQRRVLLVAGDGLENGQNDKAGIPIDLQGVDVRWIDFESRSLGLAQMLTVKETWKARFTSWGAASVAFVPTGQPIPLQPVAQTH